jgi:putative transposase
MGDRQAFEAIVYVLRTGIQWNALPRKLGASSTVHDRFQEWERAGVFKAFWQAGLQDYDELIGIQWEWQAVDGAMTKAPFGHAATGANPTARGKTGAKRSLLTDGAGIPSKARTLDQRWRAVLSQPGPLLRLTVSTLAWMGAHVAL